MYLNRNIQQLAHIPDCSYYKTPSICYKKHIAGLNLTSVEKFYNTNDLACFVCVSCRKVEKRSWSRCARYIFPSRYDLNIMSFLYK